MKCEKCIYFFKKEFSNGKIVQVCIYSGTKISEKEILKYCTHFILKGEINDTD